MRKLSIASLIGCFILTSFFSLQGQTTFWAEDFENGCTAGCLANSYSGSNGSWSVTDNSTGGAPNQWFVSCAENGQLVGSCGAGCGSDETLHVGANPNSYCTCFVCGAPNGDCGAAYDACASNLCSGSSPATDKRAESPFIDATGYSNIILKFKYIENGQGSTDNATVWYYDNNTWIQIGDPPKTSTCGGSQGVWTYDTLHLPASANNNDSIKIGFRWVNNIDGVGADPSFAVDSAHLLIYAPQPCDTSFANMIDSTDVGCFGDSTGRAVVQPSGMHGNITYSWSNGDADSIAENLSAGTYSVTVTDDSSCVDSASVTINEPAAPLNLSVSDTNASCNVSDGKAYVNATGGTSPYTYSWSNGDNTAVADSLAPGTHTVTVQDDNNCTDSASVTIMEDTLILTTSTTDASCGQSDGDATVNASNGTSPYSYQWSNGDTTATADSLSSGTYSVTISDANGCTDSATVTITNPGAPTISIIDTTHVSCYGNSDGSITIGVSGGTRPYTYNWSPNVSNDSTATGLGLGTYSVFVVDDDTCNSNTLNITINEPDSLSTDLTATPSRCDSSTGMAAASVSGGTTPYTYLWSNGALGDTAKNLAPGNYTLILQDDNGCRDTTTLTVPTYPAPIFTARPDTTVEAGSPVLLWLSPNGFQIVNWTPTDYLNDPGSDEPTSQPDETTTYYVTVTDSNGCSSRDTVVVTVTSDTVQTEEEFFIPTAFSPNEDNQNDTWRVYGEVQNIEIYIYDRWGEKVFETTDISNEWDGTFRGKTLPSGVYVYYIEATLMNGEEVSQKGNITLLR